jgi:hypothetical protein
LAGEKVKNRITIKDSDYIKINKIYLKDTDTGIIINDCNYSNISFNKIEFSCGLRGIQIDSGNNNIIFENEISNLTNPGVNVPSWAIAIDQGRDNILRYNKINCSSNYIVYHYVLSEENLNNTIVVSELNEDISNKSKDIYVKLGNCVYSWNANGLEESNKTGCKRKPFNNNKTDPFVWSC